METQAPSLTHSPTTSVIPRQIIRASHPLDFRILRNLTPTSCIKCETVGITSDNPSRKMFILGMGYVAQFFAHQLQNDGWHTSGTCRSIKKKIELEQKGLNAHVFDASEPEWKMLDILSGYSHLLVSVPPIENVGDPVLKHADYLKSRLCSRNLQWLCYLSSTSVYGDSEGAWVDEGYSPKPCSNKAELRLRAEEGWLQLGQDLGISTYVFRLGGIYGPGRSAIDTILKNEQLSERQKRRASRSFTSRIHVADICQTLKASISMPVQSKIYNIVDDDPASRSEVFEFAQRLIEKKWPGLISTDDISLQNTLPMGGQKRVSNSLMKKELGVKLLHPSYTSGLESIVSVIDPIPH